MLYLTVASWKEIYFTLHDCSGEWILKVVFALSRQLYFLVILKLALDKVNHFSN